MTFIIGGVLQVLNWSAVNDTTSPERITDLHIINAANNKKKMFILGWTAPGDDLNLGKGRFIFESENLFV